MKNNIYIFSNSILRRSNNSFSLESINQSEPVHQIDFCDEELSSVILPAANNQGSGNIKHVPAESVEAFYCFGEVRFNTQFLKCLNLYKVPLHAFNYYGNYVGSFIPANSEGSGEIQLLQFSAYKDESKRLYIARAITIAAIKNILALLKTYSYQGADIEEEINKISCILDSVRFASSVNELLGYEGLSRNIYYSTWSEIFSKDINFVKRVKRPPDGLINSLISFGNSLLYAACLSEIYRTRLNPFIGFIHETGENKLPLVYDLSEIFKPVVTDRVIFRVINLNMIDEKDVKLTNKGFLLKDDARKKFVNEFENRISTVIQHKELNRRVSYRSLIRLECYKIINYLTEKIKNYEPYKSNY